MVVEFVKRTKQIKEKLKKFANIDKKDSLKRSLSMLTIIIADELGL
jgi:hypothetical protein